MGVSERIESSGLLELQPCGIIFLTFRKGDGVTSIGVSAKRLNQTLVTKLLMKKSVEVKFDVTMSHETNGSGQLNFVQTFHYIEKLHRFLWFFTF